ncbi:MAG: S41 family peptidase [Chloroflexota bacterium]
MNAKRLILAGLVALSVACNALSRHIEAPVTPTATPSPVPLEPSYIPPQCANAPLATVPAATALARPTPVLQANPPIAPDLQKRVFEQVTDIIEDAYVDPRFNGADWTGLVTEYRGKIEGGLDTEAFYTEMQAFITALGDDHSHLESPVEVSLAEAELGGATNFVGVGVLAQPLIEKGHVTILSVFPDSPAEHSGLKPHDSILSVDGLPLVEGGEAFVQRMRGPECSAAVVKVQSPGEAPREIMLVREQITSPLSVEPRLVPTTDGSRIGYIFLPTFFDETIPDSVASALTDFGPLDGLILDNRMNGGGSSSVVEPILSLFTGGTLGNYVSREGSRPLTIEPNPIHNSDTVPLVVLVGEDTVSYGEIFSGALQDSGRVMIVGQTTLGNVETLHGYDLEDGSRLWIAEETFVPSVSQVGWEETGVIPDVEAFADWDTFTFENDPSVAAALTLLGHK